MGIVKLLLALLGLAQTIIEVLKARKQRAEGAREVTEEIAERDRQQAEKADEIDREVAGLSDDDLSDRLRRYRRDA